MKDLSDLRKQAEQVETLIDDSGRSYYMVGDRKIYEMNIKNENDKEVSDNIKMMRLGGFTSCFDMMR